MHHLVGCMKNKKSIFVLSNGFFYHFHKLAVLQHRLCCLIQHWSKVTFVMLDFEQSIVHLLYIRFPKVIKSSILSAYFLLKSPFLFHPLCTSGSVDKIERIILSVAVDSTQQEALSVLKKLKVWSYTFVFFQFSWLQYLNFFSCTFFSGLLKLTFD